MGCLRADGNGVLTMWCRSWEEVGLELQSAKTDGNCFFRSDRFFPRTHSLCPHVGAGLSPNVWGWIQIGITWRYGSKLSTIWMDVFGSRSATTTYGTGTTTASVRGCVHDARSLSSLLAVLCTQSHRYLSKHSLTHSLTAHARISSNDAATSCVQREKMRYFTSKDVALFRQDGVWGELPIIVSMALALGRQIFIFNADAVDPAAHSQYHPNHYDIYPDEHLPPSQGALFVVQKGVHFDPLLLRTTEPSSDLLGLLMDRLGMQNVGNNAPMLIPNPPAYDLDLDTSPVAVESSDDSDGSDDSLSQGSFNITALDGPGQAEDAVFDHCLSNHDSDFPEEICETGPDADKNTIVNNSRSSNAMDVGDIRQSVDSDSHVAEVAAAASPWAPGDDRHPHVCVPMPAAVEFKEGVPFEMELGAATHYLDGNSIDNARDTLQHIRTVMVKWHRLAMVDVQGRIGQVKAAKKAGRPAHQNLTVVCSNSGKPPGGKLMGQGDRRLGCKYKIIFTADWNSVKLSTVASEHTNGCKGVSGKTSQRFRRSLEDMSEDMLAVLAGFAKGSTGIDNQHVRRFFEQMGIDMGSLASRELSRLRQRVQIWKV